MPYKEKVKKQLRTALDTFHFSQNSRNKTQPIQKKPLKKKKLRPLSNFYQTIQKQSKPQHCHVLNFYNIVSINQKSIMDPTHDESHIRTIFYYKNLKKIESTDKYLIAFLRDSGQSSCSVGQMIQKYRTYSDQRFHRLADILEELQSRLKINKPESPSSDTLNEEVTAVFNELGDTPFISRISANKLVISKSMLELFGYNNQEFIIECLKFRIPLFQGFSSQMYYQVLMKNLQNFCLLMDVLHGRIPLSSLLQNSQKIYRDKIKSRNNVEYTCQMTVGMLSPLITVIKVNKILQTKEILYEDNVFFNRDLKKYCTKIRETQFQTLQHLVKLSTSNLPSNKTKVADYMDKLLSDEQNDKSLHTAESK